MIEAVVTQLQVTIPATHYISEFRDVDRFMSMCKQCGNYGSLWACPPFIDDRYSGLERYKYVTIFASKIVPSRSGMTMAESMELFRKERRRIEPMLLKKEKDTAGMAFAFAGECLYCPQGECTRRKGEGCRHPELMRPSLEAVGFDIEKTTSELFHLPLKWSTNGLPPEYYVLVSGLFHN